MRKWLTGSSFLRYFRKNFNVYNVINAVRKGESSVFPVMNLCLSRIVFLRICRHIRYCCWFFSFDICAENVSRFFPFRMRIYDLIRRQHCWFTRIRCCNIRGKILWNFLETNKLWTSALTLSACCSHIRFSIKNITQINCSRLRINSVLIAFSLHFRW